MSRAPHEYRRRILLAAAGLTPQIVTETLYALAVSRQPAFVPTEVRLVTTAEGAERARLSLLGDDPGWFSRLLQEYGVREIEFQDRHIHVLRSAAGGGLEDIRSEEDNRRAADEITELVRKLTGDSESALHVSIAGGRKTLGFYLGYALSLFGREQDRLSHVLVSAPFESHPGFYFPTRQRHVIYTAPPESRPLDTATAAVTLAEIPFVRLRGELPEELLMGPGSFELAVDAAQRQVSEAELSLDLRARRAAAGGKELILRPAELAFLSWMARRRMMGCGPLACPADGAPETSYAEPFLAEYRELAGPLGDVERTERALRNGMEKSYFLERKSRLNGALKSALGRRAGPYLVQALGRRPNTAYGLLLNPERIRYANETVENKR